MIEPFVVRAMIAGIGVAAVCGPLGCFVVWRRMAYFGDTLAHSALFGVALGLLLGLDPTLGIVAGCLLVAALLFVLQTQDQLAGDTLLGILSHASLAIGLVVLSLLETVRVDLFGYLFGDVLAVSNADLVWIFGGGGVAAVGLLAIWRPLLALTVHADLAAAEGVAVTWVRLAFMLLIALVVAVAMKVVGILLITSLLIIPAATARRVATSPEQMALLAALLGALAVVGGLMLSLAVDTPSGPSIVVVASALFALSPLMPRTSSRRGKP